MFKYKFPMEHLNGVMVHVASYKYMLVEAMSHDSVDYTLEVNIPIIPEEVTHLNENYSLVEVI